MARPVMIDLHQTAKPWAWLLEGHQASTLKPQAGPRWLRVDEGSLWVTPRDGGPQAEDLWLGPGDTLALPAGSAWVVQAWPLARLAVLQAAPAAARPATTSRRAWWPAAWRPSPA